MANRYWVGGSGTWDTTTTTNWSASSGGSGGASVPTAADSVFFDQAATYTVTMTGALACLDVTASAGTVTFATGTTPTLAVSGSMSLVSGTTWSSTGTVSFIATSAKTITTNGTTISASMTFNGTGGSWQLQDALTVASTRTVTLTAGTLNLNGKTLTTGLFASSATTTRVIAFGTGNITLTGSGTVWTTSTITGLTVTGTPVVNLSSTTSSATSVILGALTEANSISFNFTTGSYALSFGASNFRSMDFTGFTGTVANNTITIYGDMVVSSSATYTAGTNTWQFRGSTSRTITTNGKTLDFPISFNGIVASWALQDALTLGASRTLTLTAGTLDLNGKTVTVGSCTISGSNSKNLIFNGATLVVTSGTTTAFYNNATAGFTTTAGTGTGYIIMTSASAKSFVSANMVSTYNCILRNAGAGALTLYCVVVTFLGIENTVQPTSFLFTAGGTYNFTNWNINGTSGNLVTIASSGAGTHTLSIPSGTVSSDYLSISNSIATGGATWYAGANSTNGGGNTGWIFTAPPIGNSSNFLMFFR